MATGRALTADPSRAGRLRLAVLASGRGSNLQAIMDAITSGDLSAEIVGVFSDRPGAAALERARGARLPALAVRPRDYPTRLQYDQALFDSVQHASPDLIVCAGYMRLISEAQVQPLLGRMLNIHPSLLPAFKGLHTHQQALDAGVDTHGVSLHFVSAELDGGPVIAQARVSVIDGDDVATLGGRVLAREHPLLIETLRLFAAQRIALAAGRVHLDGHPIHAPLQLDQDNRLVAAARSA